MQAETYRAQKLPGANESVLRRPGETTRSSGIPLLLPQCGLSVGQLHSSAAGVGALLPPLAGVGHLLAGQACAWNCSTYRWVGQALRISEMTVYRWVRAWGYDLLPVAALFGYRPFQRCGRGGRKVRAGELSIFLGLMVGAIVPQLAWIKLGLTCLLQLSTAVRNRAMLVLSCSFPVYCMVGTVGRSSAGTPPAARAQL